MSTIEKLREILDAYNSKVAKHVIEAQLIDSIEIHEQLTDEIRGDIADLYNPVDPLDSRYDPNYAAGELLPIPLWPLWARQGGVEVLDEPNMVHSDDEGGGSWDQKGRRIKIKITNRIKAKELASRLKTVNALVDAKAGDLHLHVHEGIVQRLQGALIRKDKLAEIRNVTP